VVVEADGGSRGNPGPAGYGAVVREADTGDVLLERAEALGVATNNVAEYSGLIAGLNAAAELGAAQVEVRMDSKLVVEQMSGRWQIKNPGLRPLAAEAARLVRRFDAVSFDWIPRERNRHADALANKAMDEAAGKPATRRESRVAAAPDSPARAEAREVAARAASRDVAAPAVSRDVAAPAGRTAAQPAPDRPVADRAAPGRPAAGRPAADDAATHQPATGSWAPPSTAGATRLVLVRHGETALTEQRRYSGRGDVPLSERGEAQAQATAARVAALAPSVAAVVSSPLGRCTRTAELVAAALGGAPVLVEPDLVECDFGEWEGRTFAEVREAWPAEMTAWLGSTGVAPPGGESFQAVAKRVRRAVATLRQTYPASAVVVVSHVSPIKLILRDALAAGDAFLHRLFLDPAGVSVMDTWPDGGVAVRSVNDTAHLR
jgi:probable phosphoglycerate mutase